MTTQHRLLGATLLSLFATGCMSPGYTAASVPMDSAGAQANKAAGGIGPIGTVLGIERYFPLERTFTWTYQVTLAGATTTTAQDVTRIDSVQDLSGTKTASYTTRRTAGSTLVAQSTGTMTLGPSSLTIAGDGGSELISLPLQSGKEWTSGTLSARSYAVERLVVKNRTYKDVMAIAYSKDGETRAVRWFAPDVGIVKQVARLVVDGEVLTVTSELASAQVSAVTAVSLSPVGLTVARNATASVAAQVHYDDGSVGREVTLSISDPGLATVTSGGLLTAGSATGSAVLTARSTQDSSKLATVSVVVN